MVAGRELVIATWGIAGVVALVLRALISLTPIALEPIRTGQLAFWHWALLLGWVATNAYAEGLVGFHRKFSPRTVDRALYLGRNPSFGRVVLGPAFCLGLFQATKRTKIVSWTLLVLITMLVVLMKTVSQPWRGIVDAGVVVGLAIGVASLCGLFIHAVITNREPVLHEVDAD